MKVKLVIQPFEPNGSCKGCIFAGPTGLGDCERPESYDSCVVDSSYGLKFGIYVRDRTKGKG